MDSVLAVHLVDTAAFKQFVRNITNGRLSPSCRQTVTKQLEDRFTQKIAELKDKLAGVKHICTTADCWSSRRRSFMGITVHWIDETTLERKGACLAVRQITGSHTYDVIAKLLEQVNVEFNVTDKTCFTVTDSGSNFLKAFRHFSFDDAGAAGQTTNASGNDGGENEEEEDDIEFRTMDEQLNPPETMANDTEADDDDEPVFRLPPHMKCSCHLLNLVATNDIGKMDGKLKTVSVQTMSKLTSLWNKQNRSVNAAETIKDALGTLLVTPGATRWNSIFDAIEKIQTILADRELSIKFHKLCDDLVIKRLKDDHIVYINEYVLVMRSVCNGLDVLQGEKLVGFGYLLPTITIMTNELNLHLGQQLKICEPLVQALLRAIKKRFGHLFSNTDAQLAAVVHPKFKLYWVDDEAEKARLTMLLKRRLSVLENTTIHQHRQVGSIATEMATTAERSVSGGDFFASLAAKRHRETGTSVSSSSEQVDRYLSDAGDDLPSLAAYPLIRSLYISLNTGLPASAAVERLFSLGGRVFTPLRSRLSAKHFEMMVFLRCAKW